MKYRRFMKRFRSAFAALAWLVVMVCAFTSAKAKADEVLWTIGREDGSNAEFAMYGQYEPYMRLFPNDVDFRIGQSDPAADWCGLQPGTEADWAGKKEHTYRVRFTIPTIQAGSYLLQLRLASFHPDPPCLLSIAMNGQTRELQLPRKGHPDGWRDVSLGTPYRIDLPLDPKFIRAGENLFEFSTTGYWIVWDALSLSHTDTETLLVLDPNTLDLESLPLYVERDGKLFQRCRLIWNANQPFEGFVARIHVGDLALESPVASHRWGSFSCDVDVPEITRPVDVKLEIVNGDDSIAKKTITIKPARKWTINIVPQAHVDIGYTDLQDRAMEIHRTSNDKAVELVQNYPDFLWSVESSYVLKDWIVTRPQELVQRFFELSRKGKIETEAMYGNLLTGLLSDEEEFRSLYFSKQLAREHCTAFRSATLTDAPSHIWSIPTVLRKSGVKYLSMGINSDRSKILREGLERRSPIWWEGPDGSRVLAYFHNHYAGAGQLGLTDAWSGEVKTEVDLAQAESKIPWYVSQYDRPDYPYDTIHIHGAYGDNRPLTEQLPATVEAWNKKYVYPKIVFTTNADWFSAIEQTYGERLAVARGDGGAYWEDGAGSSALETAVNRQNQQQALRAEMLLAGLHAQGKIQDDFRDDFADIWHDIMLYNEHTWGAWNSVQSPDLPDVRRQYEIKARFALRAREHLRQLLTVLESKIGKPVSPPRSRVEIHGSYAETEHYLITIDTERGGIQSITDLETGAELVDRNAPYLFGQLVYARNDAPPYELSTSTYRAYYLTDDGLQLWLEHPMLPQIKLTVRDNPQGKGLAFHYEIEKVMTYQKEGVYIAFPLAATNPEIDYAVANAVVRAGRDWLPGACKDWFSVQNWVRVRSDRRDVVWVTYDAPLIGLQNINANQWLKELPIENGCIYAYLMNNYWHTNYKAGQGGRFEFRFALTSGANLSNAEAIRLGRDWTARDRRLMDSMVRVQPNDVVVGGFKRAEDGMGYIIRLRETRGEPTHAKLEVPCRKSLRKAFLTNGVEDVETPLDVRKGAISVPLNAWDVATVRIE